MTPSRGHLKMFAEKLLCARLSARGYKGATNEREEQKAFLYLGEPMVAAEGGRNHGETGH